MTGSEGLSLKDIAGLIRKRKPFCFFSEASIANRYAFRSDYKFKVYNVAPGYIEGTDRNHRKFVTSLELPVDLTPELARSVLEQGFDLGPLTEQQAETYLPLAPEGTQVEYSRDQSDYIYNTRDLAELDKPVNARQRQQIRRLEKQYVIEVKSATPEDADNMKLCLENWSANVGAESDYHETLEGMKLMVSGYIDGICVYFDTEMFGFLLFDLSVDQMITALFLKFKAPLKGITDLFFHQLACLHKDITYLNSCQDLGLPGLREKKTRMHPALLVHKYYLRSATQQTAQTLTDQASKAISVKEVK